MRLAWPTLNPRTTLHWSWHLDAICEHLEAVTAGHIRKLLINVAPGYSKSTLVSQCWPTWEWLRNPEFRWGFAAYGQTLTVRDSMKRRLLIESDWYQHGFRPQWQLSDEQTAKTAFKNSVQGEMVATSVGGAATGFHYDRLVVDDPHKAGDVYTVALAAHVEWYFDTWSSRKRDDAAEVVVHQRLADKDLTGALRREGGWETLILSERYEPKKTYSTSIGFKDPRTKPGELLDPVRFPEERVRAIEKTLGPRRAAAQRQQEPTSGEGDIINRTWWRFWAYDSVTPGAEKLPDAFDELVGSWDPSVEGHEDADYWAGHVWTRAGAKFFMLDRVHDRMRFTVAERAVKRLAEKWPEVKRWLVEKSALGPALLDRLKSDTGEFEERDGVEPPADRSRARGISGLVAVKVTESKLQRVESISGFVQAGDVYLPHPSIAPWVVDVIEEFAAFRASGGEDHDDDVDAATQALRWLSRRSGRTRSLPSVMQRERRLAIAPGVAPEEARAVAAVAQAQREAEKRARQMQREIARGQRRDGAPPVPYPVRTRDR